MDLRLARASNGINAAQNNGDSLQAAPTDQAGHQNWMSLNSHEIFVSECNCEVYVEMKIRCIPCDDDLLIDNALITAIRH